MFLRRIAFLTLAVALLVLLAPGVVAQPSGTVLWNVPIDHRDADIATAVGADGAVYVHSDVLYAITPEGTVRWTRALFGTYPVAVGADGRVYSGTIGGVIHAYDPDGTLLWTFDADHTTIAGPSVGPDGHLYVITEFGLGAYSLTTEGALRWSLPGFVDNNGTQAQPIPFSAGQLYHATAERVPEEACGAGVRGMVAISLDGALQWCTPLTNASTPALSPAGDLYVTNGTAELRSYSPDGSLRWFFNYPNPGSAFGLLEPAVGPDGDAYQFLSAELWGTSNTGDLLWEIPLTDGNVLEPMRVTPDNGVLLAGFARGGGQAGYIAGLNPATGSELWRVPLQPEEAVSGRTVLSPDGRVAYVPVSTRSTSRLLAIDTGAELTARDPSAAPPNTAVLEPPHPHPVRQTATLGYSLSEGGVVTLEVYDALGRLVERLDSGARAAGAHRLTWDATALPSGLYFVRLSTDEGIRTQRVVVQRN